MYEIVPRMNGRKNRLRVIRAERDLTQMDTALKAHIPVGRYWRIENGYQDPTEDEIAALARVLRASTVEMFPSLERKAS